MDEIIKRQKLELATLRLFKALPINPSIVSKADSEIDKKTILYGFICSPDIKAQYPIEDVLIGIIKDLYGISAEKLNASFHKSWVKVKDTPMEQLVVEQIAHYLTTYGKEYPVEYLEEKEVQWGVDNLAEKVGNLPDIDAGKVLSRDPDYVYIPKEALDIPELKGDLKLIVIKGYTKEELKVKLMKLLNSGIALSEDTIADLVAVSDYVGVLEEDLASIKNKEVKVIMYDKLKKVPANPLEFLRFAIYKTTGKTLIIKNKALIEAIKANEKKESVVELFIEYGIQNGLEKLAEIFYRFKPLFLAFKSLELRSTINKIRKLAVEHHRPMPEDYLNNVTAIIKNNEIIKLGDLFDRLDKANIFRKARLAYALKFRTNPEVDSILYKIRNGKGYATNFEFNQIEAAKNVLDTVIDSIIKDIEPQVKDKKIFIPKNITYTLPATEKQFTGNFPSGTYVSMPSDMIFGIHWENLDNKPPKKIADSWGYYDGGRVDLDLSVISVNLKIGWDSVYRYGDGDIMFSGDMTDARKPKGATELFYVKRNEKVALILMVNYYNYGEGMEVPFKIMVAHEKAENFRKNYMADPNNVLAVSNSKINQKQKILGLAVVSPEQCKFYFTESYMGSTISARRTEFVEQSRKFLFNYYDNAISLNEILEKAGAKMIEDASEADIDLSPEALEKDTILNLLIKE